MSDIPIHITAQPFTYEAMMAFLQTWLLTANERYVTTETKRREQVAEVSTKFVAAEKTGYLKAGDYTFKPRQRKAIDAIIEAFRSKKTSAVLLPLEGGEGKSVICWAIVKYWQDNGWFGNSIAKFPLNQAFFSTGASVKLDMTDRGRGCGVANINRTVMVVSHTEWSAQKLKLWFNEVEVETNGVTVKRMEYKLPGPGGIIIDEFDFFKKPGSLKSRYMIAIIEKCIAGGGWVIFASATPGITVNDMWLFAIATGREFMGQKITRDWWPTVARSIASRAGALPSENSPEAMAEFRKEFADCYIIPPRDPRKVRATNRTMLLDFDNEHDRRFYAETERRYAEELERCGRGGLTDINPMSLFTKFRAAEEWIKAPYFARLAYETWQEGLAPTIGVCFIATLTEVVRILVNKYGIPRSKISVIHGGIDIVTEDVIAKKVGPQIFKNIGTHVIEYFKPNHGKLDRDHVLAVKKYLQWIRERSKFDETKEQQKMRQAELLQLKLASQNAIERHVEKESFLRGTTEFMIFTLSAGGRGIDMDCQFPHVRNRRGFFTICYYAEEFMQAYYRLMRAMTLHNVDQYAVFFRGTMVADKVAPRLQDKLNSIRAGTVLNDSLADEALELFTPANLQSPRKTITESDLPASELNLDFDAEGEVDKILRQIEEEED